MEQIMELLYMGLAAVMFAVFAWGFWKADQKILDNQKRLEQQIEEDRIMIRAEES